MKELLGCIRRLDWKGLMITPSDNLFIQLFRYAFARSFPRVRTTT